MPPASVENWATKWRHLYLFKIWSSGGATRIGSKVGRRWRHLQMLQIWPPGCFTCIVTLHWIALLALSVSIELESLSARVTSGMSAQGL